MSQDLYEGFAERYDLFYGEFAEHYPAVVDFFNRLFDERGLGSQIECRILSCRRGGVPGYGV
jgi:hypothetical protein